MTCQRLRSGKMLGVTSCKVKKGEKTGNLYTGKWVSAEDRKKSGYVQFRIVSDDYLTETDFNNLSGLEGQMLIATKSMLDFSPDDYFFFGGARYNIVRVDGNRKEDVDSEMAFSRFKNNGNLTTHLVLRRAGK